MSEVEWDEEAAEAPKKRGGVPRWLWIGCGCGCLTLLVAGVLAAVLFGRQVKIASDPEVQWSELEEVLPYEERPAGVEIMGNPIPFFSFFMDQFILTHGDEDYVATIMRFNRADPSELDQMFALDPEGTPFGLGAPVDGRLDELEVQGRPTRILRFRTIRGQGMVPGMGPGVRVDLSRPGRMLLVEVRRTTKEPLSDEEVLDFLSNFDVWAE